jgi:alpha-L-rhamnosidase
LRKEFTVPRKVRRATLYVTALGLYRVYVNGKRVGDHLLAPEWTDYDKRVQYQTYEVTGMLGTGDNVIGAVLADGWYAGDLWSHFYRGRYGYNRRLLAQLVVSYGDGSSDTVSSDGSWKIWKDGPVREASIFDGEVYDARYNPRGWLKPGFTEHCWQPVFVDTTISATVCAQMNQPIRVVRRLKPVRFFRLQKTKYQRTTYIFDMGQNMAGWVKLSLPYNPGMKITIRYGEMLNDDSTLYVANLRNAKAVDVYIPDKAPRLDYEPQFTYHGFRYVEITGLPRPPEPGEVTGVVIASAAPLVSTFRTSDKDLNRLWENILWTQLSNMYGIPTDCPQRDERCGWMGDAQVFAATAMFNMDMEAFYRKWFRDIRDEQTPEGRFPNYAPYVSDGLRYYDAPGWADAGVIIPWKAYIRYGNKGILKDNIGAMRRFIDYTFRTNPSLIRTRDVGQNYGDWLNGNTIKAPGYPTEGGSVPKDLFNTAYFAYSTRLVADACGVLGERAAFLHYDSLARAIRTAFIDKYVDPDGVVTGNTQAGYALALEFGLVPGSLKPLVVKHMVDAVKAYDYRISTGIHTTERLMNQLAVNGHADLAYRLLESHRFPSWLYSVDQGATTIWERWDGYVKGRGFQDLDMNSFNNYALGAVGEWMAEHILGITPDEKAPGYRHFLIDPTPGGSLKQASGTYHSVAGEIGVSWERQQGGFTYKIEVPVNTSATVTLPTEGKITERGTAAARAPGVRLVSRGGGKTSLLVQSGNYVFQF